MAKNIFITEAQYKKLLSEGMLLTEAKFTVDNFDLVGDLINLTDPDKFFFVQIVKRWKDNKDKTGADFWRQMARSNGTYHKGGDFGNFASNTAFKVRTKQELLQLKPQIVAYCDANNARAYITSNPRSENAINSFLPKHLARAAKHNGGIVPDYEQKYGFEHLAGQAKVYDPVNWQDRVRLMLDIDTEKNSWYVPNIKFHINSKGDRIDDRNHPQLRGCEVHMNYSHNRNAKGRFSQILLPKYPNQEAYIKSLGGVNVWEETKRILAQNNIPIEKEYETPSRGLHIIIADISKIPNLRQVEQTLKMFDDGRDEFQWQLVHFNFDGKLILYSNVDTAGY